MMQEIVIDYRTRNNKLETTVIEMKLNENLLKQKIKRLEAKESQTGKAFVFLRTEMEALLATIIKLMELYSGLLDLKLIKKIKNLVRDKTD